ncbi:MAG: hypothetical protein EPO40_17590 [Myxococcaceae bacterium]|nr:MAG: hypothetical protein EPO40_17590 [Myxococcaceae bacterium]
MSGELRADARQLLDLGVERRLKRLEAHHLRATGVAPGTGLLREYPTVLNRAQTRELAVALRPIVNGAE